MGCYGSPGHKGYILRVIPDFVGSGVMSIVHTANLTGRQYCQRPAMYEANKAPYTESSLRHPAKLGGLHHAELLLVLYSRRTLGLISAITVHQSSVPISKTTR